MMRVFVLIGICVATVFAQAPDPAVLAAVGQEQMLSTAYLDVVLKFKHAQFSSLAATNFLQSLQLADPAIQVEARGPIVDDHITSAKSRLLASFYLLSAINTKTYQILAHIPEIQQQHFIDRVIQVHFSTQTQSLPAEFLQLLYLNSYNTQIKTLKLSYALQTISHFRMWLEDEMDVQSAVVEGVDNVDAVVAEQEESLIVDRQFAFNALQTYTMLDIQSFMIDLYIENLSKRIFGAAQSASASSSATSSSFMEVEAEAESQFIPAPEQIDMMFVYLKYYYLYIQYSAAQGAAVSSQLESQAHKLFNDDNLANDEDADKMVAESKRAFGAYASSLNTASQIEYMMAMYSMYNLYSPMFAVQPPAPKDKDPAPAAAAAATASTN